MLTSRTITSALGMTLPAGSLTVPEMLPPTLAQAMAEDRSPTSTMALMHLIAKKFNPENNRPAMPEEQRCAVRFTILPHKNASNGAWRTRSPATVVVETLRAEPYSEGSPKSI